MKAKTMLVLLSTLLIVGVTLSAIPVYAERAKFPRAKDYLTSENVAEPIFKKAVLPDEYLFPEGWDKTADWDMIRSRYGGTTIKLLCEGTDIEAPLLFRDQFEQISGMKLEISGVPPPVMFEKMMVAFASGVAAYDVVEYYSVHMPVFSLFFEPLGSYITKWGYDWEDWLPVWQELCTYQGKILAVPYDCDAQFWLSRVKFMNEAGIARPPKTYDEVVEYAEKLVPILPSGVYPMGFMASRSFFSWETFLNFAAPFGADIFEPGTWEPAINSPEGVNALKFLKMLLDNYSPPGCTGWGYTEQLTAWNAGQMAMCIQYPNQESYNPAMAKIAAEERWHSIIPKGPGPKGRYAPEGTRTTSILGMLRNSPSKDAAFAFIAFLSSAEPSFVYTIAGTGLDPGRKSVFDHPLTKKLYPNYQAWIDSADYMYFTERMPETPVLESIAYAEIHDVLTGKKEAKKALDTIVKEYRRILERSGYYKPGAPEPPIMWMQDVLKHKK